MNEVYKALTALGCEWLQLSSYRIKCKWRPNGPRSSAHHPPGAGSDSSPHAGATGSWGKPPPQRGQSDASMDIDVDSPDQKKSATSPAQHLSGSDGNMTVMSANAGESVRVPNLSTSDYSIKIGLTLYKVQQHIYLLDFQKMTGDAFSFMTLCANIITELKTLSAASRQAQQHALMLAQQQQQHQHVAGGGAGGAPPQP